MSSVPPDESMAAATVAAAAAAQRATQLFLQDQEQEREMQQILGHAANNDASSDPNVGAGIGQTGTEEEDNALHRLMMQSQEQGFQSEQHPLHAVATSAVTAALHASSNSVEHDTVMALTRDAMGEFERESREVVMDEHGQQHQQGQMHTPSGKLRSKGTRACDECRRKKIKCDAAESEVASCTSCRKNNLPCQFHRVPQKRGPSRGYIKELSNRVQLLEGRIPSSPMASVAALRGVDFIDNVESYGDAPSRGGTLAGTKRARSVEPDAGHISSNRGGFPPIDPRLRSAPPVKTGSATTIPKGSTLTWYATLMSLPLSLLILISYYNSIHPVFPILPHNPSTGVVYIDHMPSKTRTAFEQVLGLIIHYQTSDTADPKDFADAFDAVQLAIKEDQAQLPHVQMLLLLEIEKMDAFGVPGLLQNQLSGARDVLQNARDLAQSIGLFPPHLSELEIGSMNSWLVATDGDDDDGLSVGEARSMCRRTACSLFILQTFDDFATHRPHSFKKCVRMMLFNEKALLGPRTYRLAKLTQTLNTIMETSILPFLDDKTPTIEDYDAAKQNRAVLAEDTEQLYSIRGRLHDVLDHYHGDIEGVHEDSVQNMTFWFVRLALETWIWPIARGRTILLLAQKLVEGLADFFATVTKDDNGLCCNNPLGMHFSGAAAHALAQLARFQEYRADALWALAELETILTRQQEKLAAGVRVAGLAPEVVVLAYVRRECLAQRQHEPPAGDTSDTEAPTTLSAHGNGDSGQSLAEIIKTAAAAAAQATAKAISMSQPTEQREQSLPTFKGEELAKDGYLLAISREVLDGYNRDGGV
jgi:hypothetical protein